jgi:hypothetical protein
LYCIAGQLFLSAFCPDFLIIVNLGMFPLISTSEIFSNNELTVILNIICHKYVINFVLKIVVIIYIIFDKKKKNIYFSRIFEFTCGIWEITPFEKTFFLFILNMDVYRSYHHS